MNLLPVSEVIVICGNDRTGKTSTVSLLNQQLKKQHPHLYSIERSTQPIEPHLQQLKKLVNPNIIDQITLINPLQKRPQIPSTILYNNKIIRIKWIILDAKIQTIQYRSNTTPNLTIFQTKKCASYFSKTFQQIAFYYGIPIIQTNDKKQEEVISEIISLVLSNRYDAIQQTELKSLKLENLQRNRIFELVQFSNQCIKRYRVMNAHFQDLQIIVWNDISIKQTLILKQILLRNNIEQSCISVNNDGIFLSRTYEQNNITLKITKSTEKFTTPKLNICYYQTFLDHQEPIDKDLLYQVLDVEVCDNLILKVFCAIQYYSVKIGFNVKQVSLKINRNQQIYCISVKSQPFHACEHQKLSTTNYYSKLQKYLLQNKFMQSELLQINTYPYQQIAKQYYSLQSSYMFRFRQLGMQNIGPHHNFITINRSEEIDKDKYWMYGQFIQMQTDINNKLYSMKDQRQCSYYFISNNKKKLLLNRQQIYQNKIQRNQIDIIVHFDINHKLESLDENKQHVILDQLINDCQANVQIISIMIVNQEGQIQNSFDSLSKVLREIMIIMPRKVNKVLLRNQPISLQQLEYLKLFDRLAIDVSLLDYRKEFLNNIHFNSRGRVSLRFYQQQKLLTETKADYKQIESIIQSRKVTVKTNKQSKQTETQHFAKQVIYDHNNKILNIYLKHQQVISLLSQNKFSGKNMFIIGLSTGKYSGPSDKLMQEHLGIKITRSEQKKRMLVDHQIVDQQKYNKYFQNIQVSFIFMKSKDMPKFLQDKLIDACATYNPIFQNSKIKVKPLIELMYPSINISLIKRKGQIIDSSKWTKHNKALIASEHKVYVKEYLLSQGIQQDCFIIYEVSGSSESFLIGKTRKKFDLCDAVIQTGSTIKVNDLQIWRVIKETPSLKIGVYKLYESKQTK